MNREATTNVAVRCRGVTKNYGTGDSQVQALRGVDLDVYPAELTLLVGPSGCGKTTLLSVVAGILDPTHGEVSVLGTDLVRLSQRRKVAFRREQVGFVFQQFNLLPALTAAENVAVPLLLAGWSRRKAVAAAKDLLEKIGMADRAHALPTKLSGGQQQRVAIARRWCTSRGCWSATSRPRRSTPRPATRSWNCCAAWLWRGNGRS